MNHTRLGRSRWTRPVSLLLVGSLTVPTLIGCGGQPAAQQSAPPMAGPPPGFNNSNSRPQANTGMSTRKKVVLLAGAAALYYIYNKRKNAAAQAAGPDGKYYMSKNGRVYYRDLKTGKYQYVSPPRQAIQVPEEELAGMRGLQNYSGYNNNANGQGFGGYRTGNESYNDAEPAQYQSQY